MFNNKKKHIFNFETIDKNEEAEKNNNVIDNDDLDFSMPIIEKSAKEPLIKKVEKEKISESVDSVNAPIDDKNKLTTKEKELDTSFNTINDIPTKEIQETELIDKETEDITLDSEFNNDNIPDIKHNKTKESLNLLKTKITHYFNGVLTDLNKKLESKGYVINKRLISLHISESLISLLLLFVAIIGLFQAFNTYDSIDKLPLIKKHYTLKKEIKIVDAKIKENIKAEYLADILRFGVSTENGRYPEGGYLNAFKTVFPENIGDLQLLTFLEGWGSEFIEYQGRKIRVDHGLIKTFEQDNNIEDNGYLKGYKYHIELEGEPEKIDNVLYNIRYSNKIPKYFSSIDKKYNSKTGLLNVDIKVLFYLSK